MNPKNKDIEFYYKKAIRIIRYLMFYYLLITLTSFENAGLNVGTIFKLFFLVIFFLAQFNIRWYPSIAVGVLGFYVLAQISSIVMMGINLFYSIYDSSILIALFFRLFVFAFGGLGFYYALKVMQLKNENEKNYGTLDEDEIEKS